LRPELASADMDQAELGLAADGEDQLSGGGQCGECRGHGRAFLAGSIRRAKSDRRAPRRLDTVTERGDVIGYR
jgi:hypothetical protein